MKIKTLTALSGPGFAFGPTQQVDVEPRFAASLIGSGHALADGPEEQPEFPEDFPHRIALYTAGIKNPAAAAKVNLSTMHGLGQHVADDIEAYHKAQNGPVITLPEATPHRQLLVDNGIFSPEDYSSKTAQQLSPILSLDQVQELNDFFGLSGEGAKDAHAGKTETATSNAAKVSESTRKATTKKAKNI